jgi:C-terminal processing protease CtpA/Prc
VAPTRSASTPQDLAARTFENALLGGPVDAPVQLTLRDASGRETRKTLPRKTSAEANKFPREPWKRFEFRTLPGNVAYVALRTFGDDGVAKDFEQAYGAIRETDALILDVRENGGGSSGTGWAILAYLTDKPFQATQWRTRDYRPSFRAWGNAEKWYGQPARDLQPRGSDPYRKPVVVLTGAHTFSAAEDFTVVFDAMKRGTIIGEPTGGSTGQPLMFDLPGGGSARVCTKHDRYPDGKEFVGKGVEPQLVVRPTVEDFRAGQDTVLEAALKHLRR